MTEAIATRPATTPEIIDLPARQAAVVRIEGPVAEMPRLMGEAFELTMQAITQSGASYARPTGSTSASSRAAGP